MQQLISIIVVAAFAMLMPALASAVEAAGPAQRWAQIKEESSMDVAGSPSLDVANFVSDVYFDPTDLKNSQMTLSAVLTPAGANAQAGGAFQWVFKSSSIRKVSEGNYEAKGELQTSKGKRQTTVPFRVSLGAGSKLIMQGRVSITQGEFNFGADSIHYPAQMIAAFTIAAKPLFSGTGVFTLE